MSGYPQNRLITLWRIDAELLVCHLSPLWCFFPQFLFSSWPLLPACTWLPPAASVPRPDGHGTGVFIAQARRRCDFTPCPRQFKVRPFLCWLINIQSCQFFFEGDQY
ncbi:hypothetical protein YI53_004076 [Salmonella enterica subsp. enterica]|nr:hypothetical protein [Salmonella enterica subsp. enterica]